MKDSAPRCEDVADKLVRLFGWRQTYPVQKLQRSLLPDSNGTGPETWVGVRALRASSGGILDPDDRVRDVADDRETLTAECTNQAPQPRAAQADGASGSSAGTASPDMFRGGVGGSMRVPEPDSCVEVAAGADATSGLQVRRGSEPTLHKDTLPPQPQMSESTKRWSAAVVCREEECRAAEPPAPPAPPDRAHHFHRQTNRLSMQFSGPGSGVWLDAAERVQTYGSKSLPRDARREPLGQDTPVNHSAGHHHHVNHAPAHHHNAVNNHQNPRVEDMLRWVSGVNNVQERPLDLLPEVGNSERAISSAEQTRSSTQGTETITVNLVKGEKGLGFTITTRDNPTGGHCPIYIKNILPKGAAVTDGRLRAGDRLVSVNGAPVAGRSQQQVVALLRTTPTHSAVSLLVERPHARTQRIDPQQQYAEKAIGTPNSVSIEDPTTTENGRVSSIVNAINQGNAGTRKIQKSSSKDDLKNQSADKVLQDALNSSSHSTLGLRNRLILRLDVPVHDSEKAGLGISVKGKVTVGPDPQDLGIFIKSVLNGGAASRDGRLHTNDQLLSVNGVTLVGQSNAEAMESLRRALVHARPNSRASIELTIARRTDSMDSLARWKDDTPPNGNDTTNSSNGNNSQNCNTVIYNTNEKEVKATENYQERGLDNHEGRNKKHASIVTINNNSWVSNQSDDSKGYLERDKDSVTHDSKRDSFEWSRLDGWNPVIGRLTGLRNESYYMATQLEGPVTNGNYRPSMGHVHMSRSPPTHPNVIIEEDFGTRSGAGSAGAAGGASAESGSESGAGGAFSRDAVGRRSMSEKRHAALDAKQTGTYKKIKEIRAVNTLTNQSGEVGPALGMRKSSSLESLQIAIQETQKKPHTELIYGRTHPPLKHWLTDDSTSPTDIVRGSPQQSSLSHKKSSLLKSLSTMFRIGKPQKKPEPESCGRSQPGRSSEKSLSREPASSGRWAKLGDNHAHQPPSHQRLSGAARAARRGPAHQPQPQHQHQHQHQHQQQMTESAWGPSGHYVNYEEIQQNLHARREKLSEVQIGQMRRQAHAQRIVAEDEMRRSRSDEYYSSQRSSRDGRPQSNYYEYESVPPRRPGNLSHYH